MTVCITGAAGFIGFHVARELLTKGISVVGIDNMSAYYDVSLKKARLSQLQEFPNFSFSYVNISDRLAMEEFAKSFQDIRSIVHLAAQASVQYSLENPHIYVDTNVVGHLNLLEMCRYLPSLNHFVYASSSSVYGANTKLPFSVEDRVDTPMSLYAATKRSGELMSYCYSSLYNIPMTGLRFFTVYGPWGRPDMAAFLFTQAIFKEQPIRLFNYGRMRRNFTYIDDVVQGVLSAIEHPPMALPEKNIRHKIYNIGNDHAEDLLTFLSVIEKAVGKKAIIDKQPILPGDVPETVADITETQKDFGFFPKTSIDRGIPYFVQWYREFYGV